MLEISSKDNPKIKLYQKLSESKKHRRETGMFTLEGLRLIKDAVSENAVLHCAFITESCIAKHSEMLYFLPEYLSDKIHIITDEIAKKLSDTENSQGMFAICNTLDNYNFSDKIKNGNKFILLDNLQDPGNIGTIIRTADAVGIDAIITVSCCDIYNPKVIRSTMGSLFRMPIFDMPLDDAFLHFNNDNITSFAAVIDNDAISLDNCDFGEKAVVCIGNEGNGLSENTIKLCTHKLTIKMHGNINSLNAAMAAGIIMWELAK